MRRDDAAVPLFDALALARSACIRKRRRGVAADDLLLDTLPTLGELLTLDTLLSLDQLVAEAHSRVPEAVDQLSEDDLARVARLKVIDAYVADYGGDEGQLEIDYPALKAVGVGWAWLQLPGVQQALRAMRDEQQQVVAELSRDAAAQPLAFAKTGSRFWPRDLPAAQLRRLDRWAKDPGFERDVFAIQQGIERAHTTRDADRRRAQDAGVQAIAPPLPDGFGEWRQGAAPVFHGDDIRVRVAAFDPLTGKPTDQLLMLLMLAGQHPRQIDIATDGKLMALPGKPAMLAPLLHPWRQDDRVATLVTETVRVSREAGRPVWPQPVAAAVQAYAVRAAGPLGTATVRPPQDLGRGPTR